jgi:hypothetical protein
LRCLLAELNQNLGVSINPLIECVVSVRSFVNPDVMTHDLGRLGFSVDDRVAKIFMVILRRRACGTRISTPSN